MRRSPCSGREKAERKINAGARKPARDTRERGRVRPDGRRADAVRHKLSIAAASVGQAPPLLPLVICSPGVMLTAAAPVYLRFR